MPAQPTRTRRPTNRPAGKPSGTRTRTPKKKRRKGKQSYLPPIPVLIILIALIIAGSIANLTLFSRNHVPGWVDQQLISTDSGGRPGKSLRHVSDIAIHYVGNPGSTAQQNRDYFNQPTTEVSAHFLVGLDGEIIQCLPLNEISYATNDRNSDTISIEVCHPDETGQFNQATYDSLVKLTAWLCDHCHTGRDHVIRHYDVTGKMCPLYFVEHEDAWNQFLADVKAE